MVTVPRPPPTQERQREYDKLHRNSQVLYAGHVGKPTDIEKPLKYLVPKKREKKKKSETHADPWKDKQGRWRRPKGQWAKVPSNGASSKAQKQENDRE
ncbi:MAG: hypothetical protein JWL88_235 [Parcubacteria group bacterium]|nr:hypothetical protein [Parcubacteria group bacterium]